MDELSCTYVGSFGLLKSANKRSPMPISDYDGLNPEWFSNANDNEIFHVCPQALDKFIDQVLPTMKTRFILLTNKKSLISKLPSILPVGIVYASKIKVLIKVATTTANTPASNHSLPKLFFFALGSAGFFLNILIFITANIICNV